MTMRNDGTFGPPVPANDRRRLLLIAAAVGLLVVAIAIAVAIIALERSAKSPADGAGAVIHLTRAIHAAR
jgi:hypothetical protein